MYRWTDKLVDMRNMTRLLLFGLVTASCILHSYCGPSFRKTRNKHTFYGSSTSFQRSFTILWQSNRAETLIL